MDSLSCAPVHALDLVKLHGSATHASCSFLQSSKSGEIAHAHAHVQRPTSQACTQCVGEGGLQAVMELLHQFLESPRWEESAMERAKQMYLSHYRSLSKGLERATADRVMSCMLGPDRCALSTVSTHTLPSNLCFGALPL